MASVIARHKKFDLLSGWIDADRIEPLTDIVDGYLPDSTNVKNVEGIKKVEVRLVGQLDFRRFNLTLQRTLLSQGMDKLVFVVHSEERLA